MIEKVCKRDGTIVPFEERRIYQAISYAYADVYGKLSEEKEDEVSQITDNVVETLNLFTNIIHVETIQDIVEQEISAFDFYVAKAYITYRYKRAMARNTTDNAVMELVGGKSDYWNNENSNKDAMLATTQRDYLAGIVSTDITERMLLPKDVVEADKEGIIHFHDKDYFIEPINNCCLINLEDMLQNGTVVNKVAIEKPHRFITAMTIATQIITAVASSQYGGTTITLTHLAPFVRDSFNYYIRRYKDRGFSNPDVEKYAYEDLRKEIADGVQTFNYQINSMSTTNGQAPFISVFMYLNEDTEYTKEIAMLIEEFLHQRILGMKNEKGVYVTQAFPKLLYVLDENNIREDSEYYYLTELAAKSTAKRMNPDFISAKVMRELKGDIYPCMGCRSFLTPDTMPENGIGNVANAKNYQSDKHKYYGRFNQGVVTLNLVDLALSSGKDMNKFWQLFEERTELCHKALRCRHERLLGTTSDIAPILWQHGAFARLDKGEPIDRLLLNNYSTISLGYAGLYECVKYMTGRSHTDPDVGMPFGLEVMKKLNDKCSQWRTAETIAYSLYGTPIESTTYKFAQKLQKRFGVIKGITDHDYITNSYHINVREEINPFDKLRIESQFQALSPGGAISYIEADNLTNNIPAVLSLIRFIYDNIMYAELNTKSDYCQVCGFDGEIKIIEENGELLWECPACGNREKSLMNVSRRTCGYIGTNFWNQGRTQEIRDRYVHMTDHEVKI
jgi:ribonucleoside-triphosphate reductase